MLAILLIQSQSVINQSKTQTVKQPSNASQRDVDRLAQGKLVQDAVGTKSAIRPKSFLRFYKSEGKFPIIHITTSSKSLLNYQNSLLPSSLIFIT